MKKSTRQTVFRKLGVLFTEMEEAYAEVAATLGLTCQDCQDNCCYSYFQHHTYVEWSYLWKGLNELPKDKRDKFIARAYEVSREYAAIKAQGLRPHLMCPLNDDGLCGLYSHRLMICRMHGVPTSITMPNGQRKAFPGCHRTQELVQTMEQIPVLDRTSYYTRLATLEREYLGNKFGKLPKVDLTFAEMITAGAPTV